jgi:long-chain acyl-CoA synthetase
VAGARGGVVPEEIAANTAPSEEAFDAARELTDLRDLITRVERSANDQHVATQLRAEARAQMQRHGAVLSPRVEEEFVARERAHWIQERLDGLARERATHWGWPNVYTFTKSLAESLLSRNRGDVPTWVVRPTIVESALGFPFPGWKEGLHTSGPLVYALTSGPLRGLPARDRLVLDVIPVDFVAKGLTVVAAATIAEAGEELRVFQLGSSERNPLPMKRVVELSSLAKRKHSRQHDSEYEGKLRLREVFTADAVATSRRVYEATSIPLFRRLAKGAAELLEAAAEVLPASVAQRSRDAARTVDRAERKLETLEGVVNRFVPFVLENDCVFAAQGIRELEARLPADERGFIADPASIDWRSYWIDVHVPGLRRWVFPRIEGRRLPPSPRRAFQLEPARGAVEAS